MVHVQLLRIKGKRQKTEELVSGELCTDSCALNSECLFFSHFCGELFCQECIFKQRPFIAMDSQADGSQGQPATSQRMEGNASQ